jgi:cell wall-associated NlpC family hydrolase
MTGAKIAKTAEAQIGIEYKDSGTTPEGGFDCSGLAQYCHAQNGITIKRTAGDQYMGGTSVTTPEAGDLVFWDTKHNGTAGHVGVMVNSTEVVDAPGQNRLVQKRKVWKQDLLGYRRYWSK